MSEARIALVINKSHTHSVIKYFEGLLCARLACVRSGYYIKLGEILLVHHICQKKKKNGRHLSYLLVGKRTPPITLLDERSLHPSSLVYVRNKNQNSSINSE